VLIAIDSRVVLHKAYGWADRQIGEPVTIMTPFWIASISKQFAAAAILKLMEKGRLSLDDSIARFFNAVPTDKREITLHQLLTHTAGLEQHYAADGIADRDEAVRAILAHPLVRPPGEGFGYSNDAYNLIAAVVEIAAGQPYETYLREQLLEPAGMRHTGFWGPEDHLEVAEILHGDLTGSSIVRPNWGFRGGVGMFSTSEDLYLWLQALEGDEVLSAAARHRMLSPHVMRGALGVGYGWFVSPTPQGTTSLWTRGYEDFGHGAVLATYPEEGVVIVVTSNSGEREGGRPVSHELAEELAEIILAPR
jgi:CubicO group peptidase (beta-lactamase class C family)